MVSLPWLSGVWTAELTQLPPGNTAFVFLGASRTTWGAFSLPL